MTYINQHLGTTWKYGHLSKIMGNLICLSPDKLNTQVVIKIRKYDLQFLIMSPNSVASGVDDKKLSTTSPAQSWQVLSWAHAPN
jgi:hypothetical protein